MSKLKIKCKFCRKQIFQDYSISAHNQTGTCSHIFLEIVAKVHAEKVQCPECKMKIGALNLGGMKCSCDEWVAPAFGLSLAKVDVQLENIDLSTLRRET